MGFFINRALTAAMAALTILQVGLAGVPAPFFSFDPASATFSLWFPPQFLDSNVNPVRMYVNEDAHTLMGGFPMETTGVLGMDERFIMFRQPNEEVHVVGATGVAGNYYVREQNPGSITSWCPVTRFVFTTVSLSIVSEISSQSASYNVFSPLTLLPTTNQKIISDFSPNMTRGDELMNGTMDYTPSAQYRITCFDKQTTGTKFDYTINWEDKLGNLHVHKLGNGGYANSKFVFMRLEGV
jgi:hypothetical protein